jgi:AcrR family transcriptional regulator
MPRKITRARCSICSHRERARIEFARVSGVSLRNIEETFGVSAQAVWRHFANKHVSDDQRALYLADVDLKGLAERANAESLSLLDYLAITRSTLMVQMQAAAGCNDRSGTAQLAGKLNQTLQLIAECTGEMLRLSPHTVNHNVTVFLSSPLYIELERMLIDTLSDHPDALAKVVAGLRQLEERAPSPEYAAAALAGPSMMREINPHAG